MTTLLIGSPLYAVLTSDQTEKHSVAHYSQLEGIGHHGEDVFTVTNNSSRGGVQSFEE
jgi:hypothetical protein